MFIKNKMYTIEGKQHLLLFGIDVVKESV
jgi:hypothetical protein